MPFKSEKQRRFLWAEHPDIARRWADEYPLNGKKLPMYAKDKAENSDEQSAKSEADVVKAAKDILKRIKMPTNTGPTYAGQTDISSEQASTSILDENTPKTEETAGLDKCSMIPGTDNAQRWENEKARNEGRPAQRISAVPGVKRQIVPNIYNPLPMALSAQSGNSSPKPAAAQSATPANDAANRLMKNTIGNFGPIAANGNLNGNAAFGVKNSPNSSKTSNYRASAYDRAVEKWAFDPATASAIVGGGLGLGALGLGGAYLFGSGPNSRKGRQNAKELADYWAAQKTLNRDQHYKKHLDYRSALQAAPTEENVQNYLKHWGSKGFKSDDDWEDLEEDLPFKPFNTPGAFESDYLTDDLHTDIGNRLRDPKQFETAFRELLPKLNTKQGSTMKSAQISAPMCPCGCNEKSYNCTCPKWCVCRNPGMPCAPKKRKANTKTNSQNQKKAKAPPNFLEKTPPVERMIDGLLQTNKTHRNINTAVSAVSPMLLNALGKRLGFGVGPVLSMGANLGHVGVAHGLNTQQKMLQNFQGRSYLTKQNSAQQKYARYGARALTKGIAENAETEGGLDPTTAALMGLLGAGGIYATIYGGKKLLSPVARRMSVSTLAPEDVGQFSLPVAGGNEYAFAERYRQPNMLGSLFADSDADAVSNALMHMTKKVPGSAARLERHSEQPSLEPRDLDFVGKYLVNKYPHRYRNTQVKSALDVMRGGLGSRALASTVGHLGSFPVMTILEPRSHVNPTQWAGERGVFDRKLHPNDARAQQHMQLTEDMARANPEELENTRVYLGGPNLFREYGRLFTNPRTSLLGKTHGTLSLPLQTLLTNIMRSSAYSPYTNSVYLMGDSPAVLSHEIGHAIDFNSGGPVPKYEPGKSKIMTWLQRQGKGLKHDAYAIGRMLPFYGGIHALHQEERANTLSQKNLERTYAKDSDKLNDIFDKRQRILPAGIGSYVGNAAAGLAGPIAGPMLQAPLSIGGALGGKIYGMQQAAQRNKKYVPDNKSDDSHSEKEDKSEDEAPDTIKMPERKEKAEDKDKEERRKAASTPAWQRAAGKNDAGGLNAKGRASYNNATGGNLKAPVTESKPTGERKSRQDSFCARMGGMKKKLTGKDTANDPDSRINKALRKWNCKSSAYKGITEFSGMPGPDQISHAVSQLGMLKALVRPDDSVLKQRGITRSGFQSGLRDIYNHSRNKDRFELSELAPQPNTHAALGGLGGLGAAGLLGYAGVRDPAVLAGTAVIPAIAAYFHARNKRHNLLNTAKLVKDYGLLRPKLLRQAYPLLAADD